MSWPLGRYPNLTLVAVKVAGLFRGAGSAERSGGRPRNPAGKAALG